jgi:alpha-N-acetylglucosaminidase
LGIPESSGIHVVVVRGTSGVELAAGAGHYLRHVANVSFSWPDTGGTSFSGLDEKLPSLPSAMARQYKRQTKYSYAWNVCTHSYSFVWWDWLRWQQEIDLMALFGVNLPLAFVGQEAVVRKTFLAPPYNITDQELNAFFSGPAWLAWQRSQGMRGWGGPLPLSFIKGQQAMQKQVHSIALPPHPSLPSLLGPLRRS